MPELPEALRAQSLAALEEADEALLPALLRALDAVFGKTLARLEASLAAGAFYGGLVAADKPGQHHSPKDGKYAPSGGGISSGPSKGGKLTVGDVKLDKSGKENALLGHPVVHKETGETVGHVRGTNRSSPIYGRGNVAVGSKKASGYQARDRKGKVIDEYPKLKEALEAVVTRHNRDSAAASSIIAAVNPQDFDALVTDWDDQVERVVAPVVAELYSDSAETAFRILSPSDLASFKVSDPAFEEFMAVATKRIRDIGPETWDRVRGSLAEGIGNGETQRELQKRVREQLLVSRARAERIARTEARAARNGGAMAGARALGEFAPKFKQWIATLDGRTRHSHAAVEGQVRPLEDRFDVGGSSLDYPGDPVGPADQVVNCRCRWIAVEAPDSPALSHEGRQMEVSPLVEAEKRGRFAEVLVEAERRGLVVPRLVAQVAETVAEGSDFAASVQTLVAGLGNLADANPVTWGPANGTWRDTRVMSAPGPKALEFEAKIREVGKAVDEEVTARMESVLPVAERPTLAAVQEAKDAYTTVAKEVSDRLDTSFDDMAQAMFGKPRAALTTEQWSSVRRLVDAQNLEDTRRVRRVREHWQDLRELHETGRIEVGKSAGAEYREKVLEVLGEIRGYGNGRLAVATPLRRSTSAALNEGRDLVAKDVGKYYPDAWVADSNLRGQIDVTGVKDRAHHLWKGGYGGGDSEVQLTRRRANGMDPTGMLGNAVHEVGHRFEELRPHIRAAEWTFHNRRTFAGGVVSPGRQEAVQSLKRAVGGGYRADEVFRGDQFLDPYIGKVYSDSPTQSWEVFTMGIQSLMGDGIQTLARDPEYLHLILGLLAGG